MTVARSQVTTLPHATTDLGCLDLAEVFWLSMGTCRVTRCDRDAVAGDIRGGISPLDHSSTKRMPFQYGRLWKVACKQQIVLVRTRVPQDRESKPSRGI
jgi:hypothetical protein